MTVITVYADPNQNDPPEVYAGSDYSGDLAVGGLVVDFDSDPCFADADSNDLHLRYVSACVEAGNGRLV